MTDRNQLSDVIRLRVRVDQLEQDLSDLLHLYHGTLLLLMDGDSIGLRPAAVHFKFLQFPQGFRVGRRLVELDDRFGGVLESGGIWLRRWVYESREK